LTPAQTTWTILDLIRWTDERFQREGLATPRLDAEILLAETLGVDRVGLYTHFDQPLRPAELAQFKKLIQRRLHREPVAYIVGKREFWSLPFIVTPDVLIPRPETEVLVGEALKVLSPQDQKERDFKILEIGTGSGAVSVALAKELPSAFIVATDLSEEALSIAKKNAAQNGVRERIRFLKGDLFNPLAKGSRFELIITNPPYIPQDHFPYLAPEVRDFEPRIALDGGNDGLTFFRQALPRVGEFLNSEGWFLAEIGAGQDQKVRQLAEANPELDSCDFVQDLAGIKRVFKAKKRNSSFEARSLGIVDQS
jgi:release factor glutamine methyltransferase